MVLQEETGGVGGFTETAGDATVGVAGCGVAAGVVMNEDEGVGVVNERLPQEVARGGVRGVMHCFSGGPAEARRSLEIGFWVSFSGVITFPNAGATREAAKIASASFCTATSSASSGKTSFAQEAVG